METQTTLSLRRASSDDLSCLLEFEQRIIEFERPFDPTLRDGKIHYYDLPYMITAPEVAVVVAELNGEVIASGYARIEDAKIYQKHQKQAYLGCMYVKPAYRGQGINLRVIGALRTWATEQGITELTLQVYDENQAAVRAYEKAGFKKNLVQMRMSC